jgi:hypothetical protein
MKKLNYILMVIGFAIIFGGCEDYIFTPSNYYVGVYNNESDKFITEVYFHDSYSGIGWSGNVINDFVYPYEHTDFLLTEGTYDFQIIMEDDYYEYTLDMYEISIYTDTNLDICLDCDKNKGKVKIIKAPKSEKLKK